MGEKIEATSELLHRAKAFFIQEFGCVPDIAAAAPGRVNLIGEHTDYCDGFVMPMALPLVTVIVGRKSNEPHCRIVTLAESADDPRRVEFLPPRADRKMERGEPKWANYVKGVIANFRGYVDAFDAVICSSVPIGGGLSSSASIEVAVYTFLEALHPELEKVSNRNKALACQDAEHVYAGVPCGIMDQFISVMGKENHALMIDCRSMEPVLVPMMNPAIAILITNTNVHHELSSSEYPVRRNQCETAAKVLGVTALRDATIDRLKEHESKLDPVVFRRARHVITENERVQESINALKNTDFIKFGDLMKASHRSLKEDYEVTCRELDQLVDLAVSVDGVYGSRMTGGGFGGCTVTLVLKAALDRVIDHIKNGYSGTPTFYVCNASEGARVVTDLLLKL